MGIAEGWRHRRKLRQLLDATPPRQTLLDLAPELVGQQKKLVFALDFDGVLAPHGSDRPLPEVESWLRKVVAICGPDRVFILSNRPVGPRVDWFNDQLPGVRFIGGVRKKPYCDGLERIGELSKTPLSQMCMVDDRLLTGCLAAIRAGSQPYYVRHPFVSLRHKPFHELFFMLVRWAERVLIRLAS